MNQQLETGLCILCSHNPGMWSMHIIDCFHPPRNYTFPGSSVYQPPLFPSLESDVTVLSAFALVRRSHLAWREARQTLLRSVQTYAK
ncbi:hypothetical protein EXN66_Car007171 [Channa argus]|uniref:Uncharacterized protein n=1 Tax=Channa argus TaxID=215402 RepID=A0A6G1PNB9_CHAAH|nr:hypothetical protein EXN66_Car007171 [Channa argus]